MHPFFSVIIPCYNSSNLMQRCLASLEKQIFADFEVIFIDDCATYNTYDFLRTFCEQTKLNTHLIRMEKNGGPGKAREAGVLAAKGAYVTFMDSDDWYEKCFLENIYQKLSTDDYDMIFFDFYRNYKSGKKKHIQCTRFLDEARSIKDYVAIAFDSLCALVVKSDIIKKIKLPSLYNSEDAAAVPLLISLSHKVTYIPTPFYNYLYREQSLSTSQNTRIYQGFVDAFTFIYENVSVEFEEEKTYRGIHLVLYGAVFKAIDAGVNEKVVKDIICSFERKIPQWYENKYIKLLPLRKRCFLYLLRKRRFYMLHLYVTMQRLLLNLK